MKWIESVIKTTFDGVEAVSAVLMECGITGIQTEDADEIKRFIQHNPTYWDYVDEDLTDSLDNGIQEDTVVRFYVPDDEYGKDMLNKIKQGLSQLVSEREQINNDYGIDFGKLEITFENVDDEKWLDNWKKYYKPFKVGSSIIVKPTWEPYEAKEGEKILNINPGHVFGTGLHQSTKMCMAAIEKYLQRGFKVADLGCGSGILSVLALMLGAERAYACDIDSSAYNIAYENAELNYVNRERYTVEIGNILQDQRMVDALREYDIVVANIVADVIIGLCPIVPRMLRKGGFFIFSGIIKDRLDEVQEYILQNNFEICETMSMDEWASCTAVYKG